MTAAADDRQARAAFAGELFAGRCIVGLLFPGWLADASAIGPVVRPAVGPGRALFVT